MKLSKAGVWLSALIAVLALVAASIGLFWQDAGSPFSFTTLRGETVQIYGQGLYRYETLRDGSGFKGGDVFILVVGIPLLMLFTLLYRRGSLRGGLLLLAVSALLPFPVAAASGPRCFPETGECISGAIRAYWERYGGLRVFGYPISGVFDDQIEGSWIGPVQWFERDRLEDHSAEGLGVLAGRLGASILEAQERPWEDLPRVDQAPAGCRYFPQTGHSLCGAFLRSWLADGGLRRFGYPLTEPIEESLMVGSSVWTGTVQYFERRRMEEHPELAGTPYAVLFGLLGRDIFAYAKALKCAHVSSPLADLAGERGYGCAASLPRLRVPIAVQPFERGQMIWLSHPAGKPGTIYVVFHEPSANALVWQSYPDAWQAGVPLPDQGTPPPGRSAPVHGFGLLWATNGAVRNALGWATAPEQADRGDTQRFHVNSGVNGLTIITSPGTRRQYLLHEGPFPPDRKDTAEVIAT